MSSTSRCASWPPPSTERSPDATTQAAPATPAPDAAEGGLSCDDFVRLPAEAQQVAWVVAAKAVHRQSVATNGALANALSICQINPDRSVASVARVVSPY